MRHLKNCSAEKDGVDLFTDGGYREKAYYKDMLENSGYAEDWVKSVRYCPSCDCIQINLNGGNRIFSKVNRG